MSYGGPHIEPFVPPPEKCLPGRIGGPCAACKQYELASGALKRAFDRQRESPFVQCTVLDGHHNPVPDYQVQHYSSQFREMWKSKCLEILQRVKDADKGKVFWAAVDDKRYHATMVRDYNAIIIHPNWLDKVKRGLDQGSISTPDAFIGEMRAVFINCFTYNRPNSSLGAGDPYEVGRMLSLKFEQWVESLRG